MKKAQKENATLKRSFDRKMAIFLKNFNEHHVLAIKEHITDFLLCLACKKKCILRYRIRHISMSVAFSYSAK
jgi:hypothetical protein